MAMGLTRVVSDSIVLSGIEVTGRIVACAIAKTKEQDYPQIVLCDTNSCCQLIVIITKWKELCNGISNVYIFD